MNSFTLVELGHPSPPALRCGAPHSQAFGRGLNYTTSSPGSPALLGVQLSWVSGPPESPALLDVRPSWVSSSPGCPAILGLGSSWVSTPPGSPVLLGVQPSWVSSPGLQLAPKQCEPISHIASLSLGSGEPNSSRLDAMIVI